ncbi:LOW QUALITY PROTEIN: hypothetical protein HID58_088288 [Brassica napus]|uniref:Inhibitor I9 domain-containing protein n=1 Tax=Brassica napus TaxID=3708 RepID=A0ABQ7XVR5_BRANA|nr:LOW QUALITY PROTEIN: hypothetical protein HID58_088288 [Brassica napus]
MNDMVLYLFMFFTVTSAQPSHDGRKVYIVYMGALPSINDYVTIEDYHFSLVRSVTGKSYTPSLIVSNYGRSFDGFAAWLTEEESKKLSVMPDVFSVFPDGMLHLDVINNGGIHSGLRTRHL